MCEENDSITNNKSRTSPHILLSMTTTPQPSWLGLAPTHTLHPPTAPHLATLTLTLFTLPSVHLPSAELCRLLSLPSPASIRWAHAVNSLSSLHSVLSASPPFHFIEADVHWDDATQLPVMAHDPHTHGSPVLPYLTTLCTHHPPLPPPSSSPSSDPPLLGLKLDFKDLRAVEPTLLTLSSLLPPFSSSPTSPPPINPLLWLNADVLQGPLGPPPTIPAPAFLSVARRHFPHAVLSLGWTTSTPSPSSSSTIPSPSPPSYTPAMVRAMVEVCEGAGVSAVTFPVRARYVRGSWREEEGGTRKDGEALRELMEGEGREGWSLTVWSNARDGEGQGVEERAEERDWLLGRLPLQRTFLDLVT